MNRFRMTLMALLFIAGIPAFAQISNNTYRKNYDSKDGNFIDRTRMTVTNVSGKVEEMLSVKNGRDGSDDLIRLNGFYYMPLYNVNLYDGSDGWQFVKMSKELFARRYPQANIQTAVMPQMFWLEDNVVKDKKLVGYTQTMYCYIIASDGDAGYINARFSFKRYKDVGGTYSPLTDNWPRWERVDYLNPLVYSKLLKK